MALLVLAYPQVEKKDFDWIQNIRERNDGRYFEIVKPHFTLVFPVPDLSEKIFVDHVKSVANKFKEFYFVLRCAQIVKDPFSDYTNVFLIPEEGYRIFVKLHDALYTGPLEKYLRFDIPFIPHLGIGNNIDPLKCKLLADGINAGNLEIVGAINRLDIVSMDNNVVSTIKKILL